MSKSYCGIRFGGVGGILEGASERARARGKFMKLCGCRSFGLDWIGLDWVGWGWVGWMDGGEEMR